jgi:hypothetical protein
LDGWLNTLSLDQVVSFVAWNTGSSGIPLVALVRNWNTDSLWIESPSGWTSETFLIIPIPNFAS